VIFWFAYSKRLTWLMWVCTLGYAIWLTLQVKTWRVAYAFGARDSWARMYERVFSQSIQLLPSLGRHLPPDGTHLFLQVLLATVVACAILVFMRPSGRASVARRSA
jgi:hypothetical protein